MSNDPDVQLIEPGMVGRLLAERPDIWQMDLLSTSQLVHFSRERGVFFSEKNTVDLYQVGLLQADLLVCGETLATPGLIPLGWDGRGRYLYADGRRTQHRPEGWHGAAADLPPLPEGVQVCFHPFRYSVLRWLHRALDLSISAMQVLYYKGGYRNLVERVLPGHDSWTASADFAGRARRWNDISALAAVTEPCAYSRVDSLAHRPPAVSEETIVVQTEAHWEEVRRCYTAIGLDEIKRVCQELCVAAEILDPNKEVHTLLRLGVGRFRQRVRGELGGALVLLTMAEMVRRAAEVAFDTRLREEDELGFGVTPADMKGALYGADRILDGNTRAANEFLRRLGLDHSVRVRCYVEGSTEYGALDSSIVGRTSAIDLVNVRGRVALRRGKVFAWADSLRSDCRAGVFSCIVVDSDNDEALRAIGQAARDDLICGSVIISSPDFEFGNFTLTELEEVLWRIAMENGATPEGRAGLKDAIATAESGKRLLAAAQRAVPELVGISKGEAWGRELMAYALEHPDMPHPDTAEPMRRPMLRAVDAALSGLRSDYHYTRTHFRIDPQTLELVEREGQERDAGTSPP